MITSSEKVLVKLAMFLIVKFGKLLPDLTDGGEFVVNAIFKFKNVVCPIVSVAITFNAGEFGVGDAAPVP